MVHDGARWCKMVQDGARWCKMVQDSAIPCNTMQYHAISCNTMQYNAIPCNTIQHQAIPCIINNCWRSVPLPCGQYMAIFNIMTSETKNRRKKALETAVNQRKYLREIKMYRLWDRPPMHGWSKQRYVHTSPLIFFSETASIFARAQL